MVPVTIADVNTNRTENESATNRIPYGGNHPPKSSRKIPSDWMRSNTYRLTPTTERMETMLSAR